MTCITFSLFGLNVMCELKIGKIERKSERKGERKIERRGERQSESIPSIFSHG